jgi:orotidine-5'-phosphate decarboxylase
MKPPKPRDRLIVALDFGAEKDALEMVDRLKGMVRIFKVGSELYTACGPSIVNKIKKRSCEVFLDLKFHDIPNTVARSVGAATRLGVFMVNVHASGGAEMMKAAVEAVRIESRKCGITPPRLIAVTILTSLDKIALKKIGINGSIEKTVVSLARLAARCGMDGVVSSPEEIIPIREALGEDFLIVTPGVRPAWAASHDQKRTSTPEAAIERGASYVVVGRPITAVENPVVACERILEVVKNAKTRDSDEG